MIGSSSPGALKELVQGKRRFSAQTLFEFALVFVVSFAVLLLAMSRGPNMYDEGISLTGAMQVLAGQIPHRDFYANYGPGEFYMLAGLFKIFGQSMLVERLFDVFTKALLLMSVYAIASLQCRRAVVLATCAVTLVWLVGIDCPVGTAVVPVSLLNLIALVLILPAFSGGVSRGRMLAAGATAGMVTLFRYDVGLALLGIQAGVVVTAVFLRGTPGRLRSFGSVFWPCASGFALVTLPWGLYYLSVAPLHDFVYDILLYPSRYYRSGRGLPFPVITLKTLENVQVYLPFAVISMAVYAIVALRGGPGGGGASDSGNGRERGHWQGFLIAFSLLAIAMYGKAFVRLEVRQLYLCIVPTLLLTAVLFEQRRLFALPFQMVIVGLAVLSVLTATWSLIHQERRLEVYHLSVPERILRSLTRTSSPEEADWCRNRNPLTVGFCFLPDQFRFQTIEFVETHTQPGDRIFVGLTEHQRIFANDNLIYFATQRLPATKWAHFDPDLQSGREVQTEMVHELELNRPPYVVLDSEFEASQEPNDSSKSSGVTLLDDYLHSKYQPVQSYGEMSIWHRAS